jgi:thioesterase domain-containing protein
VLERKLMSMPPVRALGIHVAGFEHDTLTLAAPLPANVNDKGSAFGGSLASAMTLAAWGLASLKLQEAGYCADVYVQDSTLRYLKPLYDDLKVDATIAPGFDWPGFVAAFASKGKARATLRAEARDAQGNVVTSFEGRFVALRAAN